MTGPTQNLDGVGKGLGARAPEGTAKGEVKWGQPHLPGKRGERTGKSWLVSAPQCLLLAESTRWQEVPGKGISSRRVGGGKLRTSTAPSSEPVTPKAQRNTEHY